MTLEHLPRRFEIARDRVLFSSGDEPESEVDEGEDRDRNRRSHGNAKAANGGAKTTADGQNDGYGGKRRGPEKQDASIQNYRFGIVQK